MTKPNNLPGSAGPTRQEGGKDPWQRMPPTPNAARNHSKYRSGSGSLSQLRQRVLETGCRGPRRRRVRPKKSSSFRGGMTRIADSKPHCAVSLGAPVARGRREPPTREKVLTSRSDVQLRYWGVQLDGLASDVDASLPEARRHPVGAPVPVVRLHFSGTESLGRQHRGARITDGCMSRSCGSASACWRSKREVHRGRSSATPRRARHSPSCT